jgi:branched-chain amino acid transport system substrate-binding protein
VGFGRLLPLPGVAEFVKKWQATNKDGAIPVLGNVSYNGYMSTRELLRAIERAGSTNKHQDNQGT